MSSFLKNGIFTLFIFTLSFFTFVNLTEAQVQECAIVASGTHFRPGGGATIAFNDSYPPFIYLDVQTTPQCNRMDLQFLSGTDSGGAPVVISQYDVRVGPTWSGATLPNSAIVSTSNQFSFAIYLGEIGNVAGCDDTGNVCNLQVKIINRTQNGLPPSVAYDSTFGQSIYFIPNSQGLNFNCSGTCNTSWIVNSATCPAIVSYGGICQNDNNTITIIDPGNINGSQNGGDGDTSVFSEEALAPLPGFSNSPDLGEFLKALFTILIVIAGILALIMIIVGAMTYMTSDAFGKKEDGRQFIMNAILGLILALSAWIILNTINPDLAENLSISIPQVSLDGPTKEWNEGNASEGTNICPNKTLAGEPVVQGGPWPSDSSQRGQLTQQGIQVVSSQSSSCPTAGAAGCTSVYFEGSSSSVIDKIIQTKNQCNSNTSQSCDIKVTGGSECWLHSSHGPQDRKIDLRATATLNSFLNAINGNTGDDSFPRKDTINVPGLGKFYAEPSGSTSNTTNEHWHVTFE